MDSPAAPKMAGGQPSAYLLGALQTFLIGTAAVGGASSATVITLALIAAVSSILLAAIVFWGPPPLYERWGGAPGRSGCTEATWSGIQHSCRHCGGPTSLTATEDGHDEPCESKK